MLLKRRPKNEDLRPLGLKGRPYGLKRRPHGLKRRPYGLKRRLYRLKRRPLGLKRRAFGLKRRPHGLKRRPHGLKRLMLTAKGNARSRNLLRRFGNVVEFPLQYLVVIVKSITYLSFRFLSGKYFACLKPLWKCLRWRWRQFYLNKSFLQSVGRAALVAKGPRFESRRHALFSLSFSFFFFYYYFFYHSYHENNCLSRKD